MLPDKQQFWTTVNYTVVPFLAFSLPYVDTFPISSHSLVNQFHTLFVWSVN